MSSIRRSPYVKLLVQTAAARTSTNKHGNEVLDCLKYSRDMHTNVFNLSFWSQETLACYTPTPTFQAANCSFSDNAAGDYPRPPLDDSPYNTVIWKRTSGKNSMRVVLPDGEPSVAVLKVMDDGPDAGTWSVQTENLGSWAHGFGAKGTAAFGENQGIAVSIKRGKHDTPATAGNNTLLDLLSETAVTAIQGRSIGKRGDVRVMVGNLWSVLLPGDGSNPVFEKKIAKAKNGGVLWDRLHTFAVSGPQDRTTGDPIWLISCCAIAGRLAVSVGSRDLAESSFVYFEVAHSDLHGLKNLRISPAPVVVSGRSGGGPVWIGLSRIHWGYGQFKNTLDIGDSLIAPPSYLLPPVEGELSSVSFLPPIGSAAVTLVAEMPSATEVTYTATVYGTIDGREPACLKWILFKSNKATIEGTSAYIDYGDGALVRFTEEIAEPDFSGAGGTRGSDGSILLTFDAVMLDAIAAANGSNWRNDLAAYAPVSFILGNYLDDGAGNLTTEEVTRMEGFLDMPGDDAQGWNDTQVTRHLRDPFILLKNPACYIDSTYHALDALNPSDVSKIYGYHGIQYILRKGIGDAAADSLRVYMPKDWYPLFSFIPFLQNLGTLPANDVPLYNPPYTSYGAEWIKELAEIDFAALYPAGKVWIYGQYDLVIAGLPTHDLYDGSNTNGTPRATQMPNDEMRWLVEEADNSLMTDRDYNHWVVNGHPPGGIGGGDASKLGVPLVSSQARDYGRIQNSWQRTKLFQGGQFYDQRDADRFIRTVKRLSRGEKAARTYKITLPFALPEVFWGHKVRLHGAQAASLNGKTLRVYRMSAEGNLESPKVTTTLHVLEEI